MLTVYRRAISVKHMEKLGMAGACLSRSFLTYVDVRSFFGHFIGPGVEGPGVASLQGEHLDARDHLLYVLRLILARHSRQHAIARAHQKLADPLRQQHGGAAGSGHRGHYRCNFGYPKCHFTCGSTITTARLDDHLTQDPAKHRDTRRHSLQARWRG